MEGRATAFSTEGRAFAVVAAFSVYLDKRDIGISEGIVGPYQGPWMIGRLILLR